MGELALAAASLISRLVQSTEMGLDLVYQSLFLASKILKGGPILILEMLNRFCDFTQFDKGFLVVLAELGPEGKLLLNLDVQIQQQLALRS